MARINGFQEMFSASQGQPVLYKGQVIQLSDTFDLRETNAVVIAFEHTNSEWRQGIRLDVDGSFLIDGERIDSAMILWEDTAPTQVKLIVDAKDGMMEVRNVWESRTWHGQSVTHSWHAGAAMIVEHLNNGKRYLCNDGHLDDDFKELIFRIERDQNLIKVAIKDSAPVG